MKKTLALLVIAVLSLGFYSCSSSEESIALIVDPGELVFEELGGTLTVTIATDYDGDLEVTTNADWLTIAESSGITWQLTAQRNSEYKEREAVVQVKAGSKVEQVKITQLQKELFWLPYIGEDTSRSAVGAYEASRNSVVDSSDDSWLSYELDDEVWYGCEYEFDSETMPGYTYAHIFSKRVKLFDDAELVKEFLERKDFKQLSNNLYEHNKYSYRLEVKNYGSKIAFIIEYVPKQDRAYPTWDELPINPMSDHIYYGEERGWHIGNVGLFERSQNAVPLRDLDEEPTLYVFAEKEKGYTWSRSYWFDDEPVNPIHRNRLRRVMYASIDLDKVFYTFDNKKYYITDEFYALLTKSGYEFYADQGTLFFIHDDNKIMSIRTASFGDMFDGQTCISMQVYRDDVSGLRNVKGMSKAEQKAHIQRVLDKHIDID